MLNLKNKLSVASNNDRDYKIKNSDMSIHGKVKYTWIESLRSGVLNEDGNFVHISETTRQDLNHDEDIIVDPIADDEATLKPVYTIPTNSILSGRLITGLVGRIPLDGQVTDPFRFSIKIINKSFYANRHANNVLQDVIASGTASGDLRLSCVRASIDSITFIFEDGTISDHKISDIGFITNEYGFPCIKGELITDAAQYLMTTSFLSGLSSAAKATSEAQKTVTSNGNGSSSSSVTGSPSKLAIYSALSGGVDDAKDCNNILQNIVCMSIRIKRFVNNFNTEAKWIGYLSIKWYSSRYWFYY
jgi:integrating conjugative element protein (TIGR03752 family)